MAIGGWPGAAWVLAVALTVAAAPTRAESGDFLDTWLSKGFGASTQATPSSATPAPAPPAGSGSAKKRAAGKASPAKATPDARTPAAAADPAPDKPTALAPAPAARPRAPVKSLGPSTVNNTAAWFTPLPDPVYRAPEPRVSERAPPRLVVGAVNLDGIKQATRAREVDGAIVIEGAPAATGTIEVRVPAAPPPPPSPIPGPP